MSLKKAREIIQDGGYFYDQFDEKVKAHIESLRGKQYKDPKKVGKRTARLKELEELRRESQKRKK